MYDISYISKFTQVDFVGFDKEACVHSSVYYAVEYRITDTTSCWTGFGEFAGRRSY